MSPDNLTGDADQGADALGRQSADLDLSVDIVERHKVLFVGDGFELVLAVAGKCLGVPSPPPPEGLVRVLTA